MSSLYSYLLVQLQDAAAHRKNLPSCGPWLRINKSLSPNIVFTHPYLLIFKVWSTHLWPVVTMLTTNHQSIWSAHFMHLSTTNLKITARPTFSLLLLLSLNTFVFTVLDDLNLRKTPCFYDNFSLCPLYLSDLWAPVAAGRWSRPLGSWRGQRGQSGSRRGCSLWWLVVAREESPESGS